MNQQTGVIVTILYGDLQGKLGRVYDVLPGYDHPYHVRPLDWPNDIPGIALCEDEIRECLARLDAPMPCGTHALADQPQQCKMLAHWRVNGIPECDECILDCVERLPDNAEWLAPALQEIVEDAHQFLSDGMPFHIENADGRRLV